MKYSFCSVVYTISIYSCQKDDLVILAKDNINLLTTETDKLILDIFKLKKMDLA